MKKYKMFVFFIFLGFQISAQNIITKCNTKLIEVVMEDVFSPPLASRVHVYPNLAAYEVVRHKENLPSILGQIDQNTTLDPPTNAIDYDLGALIAFSSLAKELVYTEYMITDFKEKEIATWMQSHHDSVLFRTTENYALSVAAAVSKYLKGDNYNYTRTLMRYIVVDTPGAWQPTTPDFMNALEPNWGLIRSFYFTESSELKPKQDIAYSESKKSAYYKSAKKLYKDALKLSEEQKQIALYWDDNPNTLKSNGHLSYFIHKISPVGHWLTIAGRSCTEKKFSTAKTAELFAILTLAQYEAVRACWKTKYQTNAVRPITYINKLIKAKWTPLIETPPFPEYTSGHSCISGSSATVLTHFIPQPYAFVDSTQNYLGMPPRRFESFNQAAQEASMSRYYGGIHYKPALDNGVDQGIAIAKFIIDKYRQK